MDLTKSRKLVTRRSLCGHRTAFVNAEVLLFC